MALVSVTNVLVLDNPTAFANPFAFEITFECIQVGASRISECFPPLALVDRRVIGSHARRVRSVSKENSVRTRNTFPFLEGQEGRVRSRPLSTCQSGTSRWLL